MSSRRFLLCLPALVAILVGLFLACTTNNPWPGKESSNNIFFTSYGSRIKSLDPAVSYYVHEGAILDNIIEAPLAYDYLERPYKLIPCLLTEIPEPVYFDQSGNVLPDDPPAEQVARVEYILHVRDDVLYQPHPCFARNEDGSPAYRHLNPKLAAKFKRIADFPWQGTRLLKAEDFKVALTRFCDPSISAAVYSTFKSFIDGIDECSQAIMEETERLKAIHGSAASILPDYRKIPLKGLQVIDDHTLKLVLRRKYPQATYWMAMHFFSPIPYETLEFYNEPALARTRFNLRNWPVGTGAFMMDTFMPEDTIILARNPHFHDDFYPSGGSDEDRRNGLLDDAGQRLPFLDKVYFHFEQETIPTWLKFLQGYYDTSGIPNDMFDAAVAMSPTGDMGLSDEMQQQGIYLVTSVSSTTFYFGFNMLDSLVGGLDESKKYLRQAISIAINYQEFIDIFQNGRGVTAQSIIPPGIYGSGEGKGRVNPVTDEWDDATGQPRRKSMEEARALMVKAGYPNGIGKNGEQLVLYLDHASAGAAGFKAQFQWLKRIFAELGIRLEERPTDLNRYRENINNGNWQMFFNRGWVADYPDPENFLFLFYSPNGVVASGQRGSNYSNYNSPQFDEYFRKLETMANGPQRMEFIQKAIRILQEDAPCCWGFHPTNYTLCHEWLKNYKPHNISHSFFKYYRIDTARRQARQQEWNRPRLLVAYAILAVLAALATIWLHKRTG